jgi:hypothetical protein
MFWFSIQPSSRSPSRSSMPERSVQSLPAVPRSSRPTFDLPACWPWAASGARVKLRTTVSPINRMLPGSLAKRHDAHHGGEN